jgi:ribosome biogenesis GTPase A
MEQKVKNVHWFPGHMKKISIELEDKIKLVDFVIILLDSRIPLSSKSDLLESIVKDKKKLYILTKTDLSDELMTEKWLARLNNNGDRAIGLNLKDNNSKKEAVKVCEEFASLKREKYLKRGVKNITVKAMVLGIPNVGKSTFINLFASKRIAVTGNIPGVTRNTQWVKVGNFELMDVPGILEPNYHDKQKAINLALIGSMKESVLPTHDLALDCLDFLKKYYCQALNARYKIEAENLDNDQVIIEIGKNRGYLIKNDNVDVDKTELLILNEFRNGLITNFTLERI